MAKYKHGVGVNELATQVGEPQITLSGIPVVIGTAPVHLAKKPKVNELVYAESYQDAVEALGYVEDFEKYTLCQSIFASFKKFAVGPVIFINVLDPEKHKKSLAEADYPVTENQATVDVQDVILTSLTVKNGDKELEQDADYIATFNDDNNVLITLLDTTNTAGATSLTVSGSCLDASKVLESDIIGGYDEDTGVETGLELVRSVFPTFQVFPGTLLAPGYSKKKNIAAMLQSKCEDINGMFDCQALVDLDTEEARKYADVEKAKSNIGVSGQNTILLWPMMKYGEVIVSYSAVMAALIQYVDKKNGGVPAQSPSNQLLGCDAICLQDGTEVRMDEQQANTVNAVGVVAATNYGGWRSWGNNTACYPLNKDPKDRWINCRRYFTWRENNFIVNVHNKVDGIPNVKTIQGIVDNENIKGNSYVAAGYCAGDKVVFRMSENPIENIIDGKFKFHFYLSPFPPMEYIEADFEMDVTAIENAYKEAFGE